MLCHTLMAGLFSFPIVQFIAFFLALYGIDDIALFVSWCFVLGVDQSLSEGVGGLELHRDVPFLEDSPELFRNSRKIRDRNAVKVISILFFLGVWFFRGCGEGPVWVATCFLCCFDVFLFLLSPLGCGGYFFGPMLQCFDLTQLVFKWVV